MRMKRGLGWAGVLTLSVATLAVSGVLPVFPDVGPRAARAGEEPKKDRVVLKNGRTVEGTIVSETDDEVEIIIEVRGIKSPASTKFKKIDVLAVERAAERPAPEPAQAKPDAHGAAKAAPTPASKPVSSSDTPKVYLMELEGDFGWDISKTSLQAAFNDAISMSPAAIVVRLDCGTRQKGFNGLWTSEDLGPIVEKAIQDGHRVVFWIERAESGAAFLPFVSPEIYFHPDGKLGGVGDLSNFDMGDKWVNEKQISLRLGHAEGFAIKGGYDPVLIRAMARREVVLAVRWEGGQPIYLEHEPRKDDPVEGAYEWTILTDDGAGKNKDEFSFEGNDVLNLDAKMAYDLRVSRGDHKNIDSLVFALDVGRDAEVVSGRSKEIIKDWETRIERGLAEIRKIQAELKERGAARTKEDLGKERRSYEQMRSIVTQFAEVLDPSGQQLSAIDLQLERIRLQFQQASEREKRQNNRR